MKDPATDLARVAERVIHDATIYPQPDGTLVVVITYRMYVALESQVQQYQKAVRAQSAQTRAGKRPVTEPAPPVPGERRTPGR
jgi:hypothetical protein